MLNIYLTKDGKLSPIHELPDETAATIAQFEVALKKSGDVPYNVVKVKQYDNTACFGKSWKISVSYR